MNNDQILPLLKVIIYLLLELTVGFETNIKKNFDRKAKHYQQLLAELSNQYKVYYVNLSLGAIGSIGEDTLTITGVKIGRKQSNNLADY